MASEIKNLSDVKLDDLIEISDCSAVLVVSEYYTEVTDALYQGAVSVLAAKGIKDRKLHTIRVPGSFELVAGAVLAAERYLPDVVICLGCVVKGETRHDDYINQAVATGLAKLTIEYKLPFIFGLLTTEDMEQAMARAGGDKGNKGIESAVAAIQMIAAHRMVKGSQKAGFIK